jgi:hypothetical protein
MEDRHVEEVGRGVLTSNSGWDKASPKVNSKGINPHLKKKLDRS